VRAHDILAGCHVILYTGGCPLFILPAPLSFLPVSLCLLPSCRRRGRLLSVAAARRTGRSGACVRYQANIITLRSADIAVAAVFFSVLHHLITFYSVFMSSLATVRLRTFARVGSQWLVTVIPLRWHAALPPPGRADTARLRRGVHYACHAPACGVEKRRKDRKNIPPTLFLPSTYVLTTTLFFVTAAYVSLYRYMSSSIQNSVNAFCCYTFSTKRAVSTALAARGRLWCSCRTMVCAGMAGTVVLTP
jgi:hypothetical protein